MKILGILLAGIILTAPFICHAAEDQFLSENSDDTVISVGAKTNKGPIIVCNNIMGQNYFFDLESCKAKCSSRCYELRE